MRKNFLKTHDIPAVLAKTAALSKTSIREVVARARTLSGLTLEETALLLNAADEELIAEILSAAKNVKEDIYGSRLVLFTPLYVSDQCVNDCLYCGFRKNGSERRGRALTKEEIQNETTAIINDGHKRILLVAAENPAITDVEYIANAVETIYSVKAGKSNIRRVNVNMAPLSIMDFKKLKASGIGTYQLFQETYDEAAYKKAHAKGPKADFLKRLYAMHDAMEAGIDDVGIGALFGLGDWRVETLSLLAHSMELEKTYGAGPHTISIPRLEPANGAPLSTIQPNAVSDADFMKLTAILRLAVPYTGIILSTRESAKLRNTLFHLGVSQISANSRTTVGGHINKEDGTAQFSVHDKRTTEEIIRELSKENFSPSFCTACYRTGRTGSDFMELAKPGEIKRFCVPNSILSFKEYLLDFGEAEMVAEGEGLIKKELEHIKDAALRSATEKKLREMEEGKRDLFF
ncbi:MAG: [FeFe] hydrogenase H-cluster radical SAM maturase HydG [Deltaproteobacteria bacterium]|nr:[FeFe] hydrogenase H-cluster radical SAM maturase HydG [Deltaproteobacteria bacterium]